MNESAYYYPVAITGIAFVLRIPHLIRARRDPLVRSIAVVMLLGTAVFWFAAPPSIAAVNKATGVPNFSAPLVYSLLSAFSAAQIILIIRWQQRPAEEVRAATWKCVSTYGSVMVALWLLFAAGDAPVERLRDLDTYYANTPYIGEMIFLYLVALAVAALVMTSLCWKWSRSVHGLLRAGLVLLVIGNLLNFGFTGCKLTAVIARWCGFVLDDLSTFGAPPLAALSSLVQGIGFVLPMTGQRANRTWQAWDRHRALGPLWSALQGTLPRRPVRFPLWSAAQIRLQREAEIHDGLLALDPYFDAGIRVMVSEQAMSAGMQAERAQALGAAAMVRAALAAKAADPEGEVVASAETYQPDTVVGPDLALVARAFSQLQAQAPGAPVSGTSRLRKA
ncbi:MAB_1171c family putative transporter [Streptomyces sp. NPDC096205]|uniref:MAB_1171c family putative transporter n=1 Tax=Streptomyces sp. NPDC096205 TaxID=3366081 RepID=UPI003804D167